MQAESKERHKNDLGGPSLRYTLERKKGRPRKNDLINPVAYLPISNYIEELEEMVLQSNKVFQRPKAVYTNSSPYGIAAEMLAEQMNEEIQAKKKAS